MFEWLKRLFGAPAPAMVVGNRPPAGPSRVNVSVTKVVSEEKPAAVVAFDEEYDFSGVPEFDEAERNPVVLAPDEESLRLGKQVTESFLKLKSDLPAFPALATRILQVAKEPDVNMNKFVHIVSQDPAIATRILRVANSVFYSAASEITSTRDAVVRVGLKDVASLVAAASSGALFELDKEPSISHFDDVIRKLWQNSMTCAFAASNLSMTLRRGSSEQAFLGGMLHDIGKMIALRTLNELAEKAELAGDFTEHRLYTILEQHHHNLGFEAISIWNLPEFLLEICMEHHGIEVSDDSDKADLHIIRVVSGLNEIRTNPFYPPILEEEIALSARELKITAKRLKVVVSEIREFAEKAAVLAK